MLLRSHAGGDVTDQDRERCTKLVADFEVRDLRGELASFGQDGGLSPAALLSAPRALVPRKPA